ncbi:MAG: M12 family metallo-peptidase [Ferruginibacter sp.]
MRKNATAFLFLLLFTFTASFSQQTKRSALYDLVIEKRRLNRSNEQVSVFTPTITPPSAQINESLSRKNIFMLDRKASTRLFNIKPASITFLFPVNNIDNLKLELVRQEINSTMDFALGAFEANGIMKTMGSEQGLHYRGYINGDPSSVACISIFRNGDVMGIFCNNTGNYNIGKTSTADDQYLLYNSNDLKAPLIFNCATTDSMFKGLEEKIGPPVLRPSVIPPALLCKKVRIFWEADYKLYNNNFGGNFTNTANYLTGLFNEVSTMYQNEGILIELTDTYIWTTPDPYNTATSSNGLTDFKARWNGLGNNFKADLAVLIDGSPTNNGGIAYLLTNNLCNRSFAYGYADIYGSYNSVPVYSWDVEVVTHEMGHMMGSHHTHWCGWNTGVGGTCGAIDNCATTESGGSCTSCTATTNTNPTPPAGFNGTVMSYCHLRSGIEINLSNGFGPLPQNAIRNTISIASCAIRDNKWTGAVSTAWEDPANWGCGLIPDETTDVTVSSGLIRYPEINSGAVCRRLIQDPVSSVSVRDGFTLMIAGLPANP